MVSSFVVEIHMDVLKMENGTGQTHMRNESFHSLSKFNSFL